MDDPFHLQRFVDAQRPVFEQVLRELRAGRKQSHWIWFIFPQLMGLGYSSNAEFYGIASAEEAAAYLHHPVLGQRLRDCTALVNAVHGKAIQQILGTPDDIKYRSSMTLFARVASTLFGRVAPENEIFRAALEKYFDGVEDPATIRIF